MNKKYYLWLVMVFGYGNIVLYELLKRFETPENLYGAFMSDTAEAGKALNEKAKSIPLEKAEKLLNSLEQRNISIITIDCGGYPEMLKRLEAPPLVLFAKGNACLLKNKLVTAAGARKITDYTIAAESAICSQLCRKYTLVGSLGEGCEQLACLTAVKCGMGCIEVLPCGIDNEYPKGSRVIREQLLMNGGCVVTEFLPDVKAGNPTFLRRAKISGGISSAMIIFQAGVSSGSLNAAKYSQALFFLPPNNIFSPEYAAAVKCVRSGASLYLGENDIKAVFDKDFKPKKVEIEIIRKPPKNREKKSAEKKTKKEKAPAESVTLSEELFESPVHYSVFNKIHNAPSPVTFDEILDKEELDIAELSEILLDLEISDMIKAAAGGRYISVYSE